MKNLILAGAAALAFTAMPAAAQDMSMDADADAYVMTDTQTTSYEGWPADRRTAYDAWPMGVQEYYWTLTPVQTEAWWMLDDAQRVRIYEMTPEMRTRTFASFRSQMNATTEPMARGNMTSTTANANGAMNSNSGIRFERREMVQTTPNARANGSEYPPCRGDVQDSCVNPREAGLNYGNRPLQYWPGRPASEIDGPLPAKKPN